MYPDSQGLQSYVLLVGSTSLWQAAVGCLLLWQGNRLFADQHILLLAVMVEVPQLELHILGPESENQAWAGYNNYLDKSWSTVSVNAFFSSKASCCATCSKADTAVAYVLQRGGAETNNFAVRTPATRRKAQFNMVVSGKARGTLSPDSAFVLTRHVNTNILSAYMYMMDLRQT
jgi:hypothetical protein